MHRENLAYFKSPTGQPVMQTYFQHLERLAATIYTRQIFRLFCSMLHKANTLMVIYEKEMSFCKIYKVLKFYKPNMIWHVSFHREKDEFKCSCMRMDSISIPCSHILAILSFLDIVELPKSLVLRRWTRKAKEGISGYDDIGSLIEDSLTISQRAYLAHYCKQVMNKGCLKGDLFNESRDASVNILSWIRAHSRYDNMMEGHAKYIYEGLEKNVCIETETTMKPKRCSYCRKGVHNTATCSMRRMLRLISLPICYFDPGIFRFLKGQMMMMRQSFEPSVTSIKDKIGPTEYNKSAY
ncbi:hypothetical protein Ahy_A03g014375 [Arachis hypogaea]|uniref:Protein FAR1-RELATED SEQUENCE n=1 Tax=Arachis hypogaea TaxID=3818 RepID=A0A445DXI9_ARAHY|nr:hypothetical protein Ahy_A03g014375 [Arachis hypogaea]